MARARQNVHLCLGDRRRRVGLIQTPKNKEYILLGNFLANKSLTCMKVIHFRNKDEQLFSYVS